MTERTIVLSVAAMLEAVYAQGAILSMMAENREPAGRLPLLNPDHRGALLKLVEQGCSMLSLHLCRFATDIDTAGASQAQGSARYTLRIPGDMPVDFETELRNLMQRFVALSTLSAVVLSHDKELAAALAVESNTVAALITGRLRPMPPRSLRLTPNY